MDILVILFILLVVVALVWAATARAGASGGGPFSGLSKPAGVNPLDVKPPRIGKAGVGMGTYPEDTTDLKKFSQALANIKQLLVPTYQDGKRKPPQYYNREEATHLYNEYRKWLAVELERWRAKAKRSEDKIRNKYLAKAEKAGKKGVQMTVNEPVELKNQIAKYINALEEMQRRYDDFANEQCGGGGGLVDKSIAYRISPCHLSDKENVLNQVSSPPQEPDQAGPSVESRVPQLPPFPPGVPAPMPPTPRMYSAQSLSSMSMSSGEFEPPDA